MLKSWWVGWGGGGGGVAHEILETAQSPKYPLPFWIWGWDLESGLSIMDIIVKLRVISHVKRQTSEMTLR